VVVLEGFAFLLILASEALRGRLFTSLALPAKASKPMPQAIGDPA
jgi:hypothetical protein